MRHFESDAGLAGLILLAALVLGLLAYAAHAGEPLGVYPDPQLTPGVADPAVTQDTILKTICVPGYTKTVRNVPQAEKRRVLAAYRKAHPDWPACLPKACEYDHKWSLELGGANDDGNIWPEPYAVGGDESLGARAKDRVENELHRHVCPKSKVCPHCVGDLLLAEAQRRLSADWRTALDGLPEPSGAAGKRWSVRSGGREVGYLDASGKCWVLDVHGEATFLDKAPQQCATYLESLRP